MNRYKAILFDVDDTLLDFDSSERAACRHVLDDCLGLLPKQRDVVFDAFLKEHNATWNLYMEGTIPRQDVPSHTFERLSTAGLLGSADPARTAAVFQDWFTHHSVSEPGAVEVLALLRTQYRTGVISNYEAADVQRARLAGAGLTSLLDTIVISADCSCEKPDPAIFRRTLQLLRLRPPECLYVGDSLRSDAAGAHAAGIDFCWYRRHHTAGANPDTTAIMLLTELPSLLGLPVRVDHARSHPTMKPSGRD